MFKKTSNDKIVIIEHDNKLVGNGYLQLNKIEKEKVEDGNVSF